MKLITKQCMHRRELLVHPIIRVNNRSLQYRANIKHFSVIIPVSYWYHKLSITLIVKCYTISLPTYVAVRKYGCACNNIRKQGNTVIYIIPYLQHTCMRYIKTRNISTHRIRTIYTPSIIALYRAKMGRIRLYRTPPYRTADSI
jgi:hypothetical protein